MRNFVFATASSLMLFLTVTTDAQGEDNNMSYKDAHKPLRKAPLYYLGNYQYPYQYHGGYFWYPHAQGNVLKGYNPYHDNKGYWYASYMHPHSVYVDKVPVDYVDPHPMDEELYNKRATPMQKKWGTAPEMKSGRNNIYY